MSMTIRGVAAILALGLGSTPWLASAEEAAPGTGENAATEWRSPGHGVQTRTQRRADRAVLTLQQDALGRIIGRNSGKPAGPLTRNDPEITRSPAPPSEFEVIRL